MTTTRFRPALATLERRDTPAFTSMFSTPSAVLLFGDAAADNVRLTESGGLLRHNRATNGDPGFASDFDWDTTTAGVQNLAAAAGNVVTFADLGGGDDSLLIGSPSSPASKIQALVSVLNGGGGKDDIRIENAAAATYEVTSGKVQAAGVNVEFVNALENGIVLVCGAGKDTVNVRSTSNPLTIEGTGGLDTVRVGSAAGGMNGISALVRVTNAGDLQNNTALVLDDSADTGPNNVTIADSDFLGTIVSGLSGGAVEFDPGTVFSVAVETGSGRELVAYQATRVIALAVTSGGGDDQFVVNVPAGATGNVGLVGEEGADAFDIIGLVPAGLNLTVNGSDRAAGDVFTFGTTAGATATITHTAANAGTAQAGSGLGTVQFFNMGVVALADPPRTLIVNLPATANAGLVLGDDGGGVAGASRLTGPTITPTQFDNPTVSLAVNLGNGGDAITMTAMDAAFAPTTNGLEPGGTFLRGGTSADTFTVTPDGDSLITVIGGAPAAAPGDTLNVPSLVNTTGATTPDGALGASPNGIAYREIETLNVPAAVRTFAAGSDRGGGTVRAFNADQSERFSLAPFGAGFTGGVRVAAADFNGDGVADVVTGTGPGGPTKVRVFDGATKAELFATDPFEAAFTGGVYVAAGDINGDGVAELVITPDEGGGPRVRVFDGNGFALLADFLGIDDRNFRGGARAAVGDIDGDGFGELVVGAGFGGGPRVAAYRGATLGGSGGPKLFGDFFLFEQGLRNGAFVAVGDVTGDGKADLIGGGGPGGGPRVFILSGADLTTGKGEQSAVVANFFAGDTNSRGGVRVAAANLDGDAKADLVVGAGAGAGSRVTAYLGAALGGTPAEAFSLEAFPGFAGGVFVG